MNPNSITDYKSLIDTVLEGPEIYRLSEIREFLKKMGCFACSRVIAYYLENKPYIMLLNAKYYGSKGNIDKAVKIRDKKNRELKKIMEGR